MTTAQQHHGPAKKKKPSSPETREANRRFLERHPERGGRLMNPNDPKDAAALAEWRALYAEAKQRNAPPAPKPAPSTPTLPCQTVKQECELASAEVKCSHHPAKRNFKVDLPLKPAAKGGAKPAGKRVSDEERRTICVIAGRERTKESILVKSVLKKPLCNAKHHVKRHIIVKPPFNAPEQITGAQQLKFDVKSSLVLPNVYGAIGKAKVVYKYIWPSYQTKDVYYVDVDACTTNGHAHCRGRSHARPGPRRDPTALRLAQAASDSSAPQSNAARPGPAVRPRRSPLPPCQVHRRLHPRAEVEFAQDVLHVDLHRGLGDAQIARHFLVAGALGDQAEDLALTG